MTLGTPYPTKRGWKVEVDLGDGAVRTFFNKTLEGLIATMAEDRAKASRKIDKLSRKLTAAAAEQAVREMGEEETQAAEAPSQLLPRENNWVYTPFPLVEEVPTPEEVKRREVHLQELARKQQAGETLSLDDQKELAFEAVSRTAPERRRLMAELKAALERDDERAVMQAARALCDHHLATMRRMPVSSAPVHSDGGDGTGGVLNHLEGAEIQSQDTEGGIAAVLD